MIVFQAMWCLPVHNALLAWKHCAHCAGNNHDLYALVNVIFYVLTIFDVTNTERYKKCSTGMAVAQLAGGLQVFSFFTNIVELGV